MKPIIAIFISIILLLFLSINSFAQQTITSLLKQVQPSTVLITVYDAQGNQSGQGSGFFISKKGEVATNWHVISNASSAMVKTATGAIFKVKGVVAKDEKRDIAKIVLEAKDIPFPYLNLSPTIPKVGERIFVVGSPYGLESTVSDGLVSAVRKIPDVGNIIQISAPISPGSSGSPVINLNGQVVGIATFQFIKGQNLNFAVSAVYIAKLSSVDKASVTPLSKEYLSKINPEVQLQDNGWIRIVSTFTEKLTAEEFYGKNLPIGFDNKEIDKEKIIKRLHVTIQFLKPCVASTLRPDLSKEFEDHLKTGHPESPKAIAFGILVLGVNGTEEERVDNFRAYTQYCKKVGIDSYEFLEDISLPKFRCDYRIKVFVTFFVKKGYELKTDSVIPWAMLIESSSNKRKTEMLPGEKTSVTFIVPDNAEFWYVWVPK